MRKGLGVRRAARRAASTGALPLVVVCLLPAPFLFAAHVLHERGVDAFRSRQWDVEVDQSWLEVWGYVLVGLAVVLLLVIATGRRRAPVHAAWAVALTVLVLDDALAWHERGGHWLTLRAPLPDPPGLRTQDVGELAVWAGLGAAVLLLLWSQHRRSPARARRDSWHLAGWIVVLAVFAVGVDLFHVALQSVTSLTALTRSVGWLEAGGQLLGMAGLLATVVHVLRRPERDDVRPWAGEGLRTARAEQRPTGARSPSHR